MAQWTFFSNHGHVLVCLSRNHESRLRDVAADVGITERAVQKIIRDLQDAGYITVSKHGRRNRYRINSRKGLRHSLESHCTVGKMLTLLQKRSTPHTDAPPASDQPLEPGVTAAVVAPSSDPRPSQAEPIPPARVSAAGGPLAADAQTVQRVPEPSVGFAGKPAGESPGRPTSESPGEGAESRNPDAGEEETGRSGPPDVRKQGSLF